MSPETELNHFESVRPELLQHHEGKFASIVGTEVLGVFDHPEAYAEGIKKRGNLPMLIKLISRQTESIPAMLFGLFNAHL